MKKTLIAINSLVENKIIAKYAIAGGMAQFYYIEPSVTYDLDLIISLNIEHSALAPLTLVYRWASENNYSLDNEHIIIEGIPVQFLLAYNSLVTEALEQARGITIFGVDTFILAPEYLMAIMLQTGRSSDKERLLRFFSEADFIEDKFNIIIKKFDLIKKYQIFRERFYAE